MATETNEQILRSYTISNSPKEILEVISKSGEQGKSILWQSYTGHKTIFEVKELQLEASRHRVRVSYDGVGELVDPKRTVYLKVSFRECVFKGDVAELKREELLLNLPHQVHVREFREVMRQSFPPRSHYIEMRPYVAHLRPDQLPTMQLNLRDISLKGLGLYVSDANAHFFKKGKFVELTALGKYGLPRGLLGQVAYFQRQRGGRSDTRGLENRVGIKMLDLIPEALFNAFVSNSRSRPSPLEDLLKSDVLGEDFKDMLTQEVSRTLKKLKQRPAISKYLNQLEVLRGEDDYVPEHIQVLGVICTFIARSMNWVSEASLEKFVYAAFIHDAPLFQYPRLTRIAGRADFEARRGQLSSEEIAVFLAAPDNAAAIAAQDAAAPPDVGTMLKQQKAMPDGSGLPEGLSHTKITPMAALFIIAHSLTDEIMENPDWDLAQWLVGAKKRYKGGAFNKVIQALDTVKITMKR